MRELKEGFDAVDGVRTYFKDAERASPPVLFSTGFADPLDSRRASPEH